jgi:hypothetical protein
MAARAPGDRESPQPQVRPRIDAIASCLGPPFRGLLPIASGSVLDPLFPASSAARSGRSGHADYGHRLHLACAAAANYNPVWVVLWAAGVTVEGP